PLPRDLHSFPTRRSSDLCGASPRILRANTPHPTGPGAYPSRVRSRRPAFPSAPRRSSPAPPLRRSAVLRSAPGDPPWLWVPPIVSRIEPTRAHEVEGEHERRDAPRLPASPVTAPRRGRCAVLDFTYFPGRGQPPLRVTGRVAAPFSPRSTSPAARYARPARRR